MGKMTTSSTSPLSVWTSPRKSSDPELDGLSVMDRLWNQLDGMFIGLWASKFTNAQTLANWRNSWAMAFVKEGITTDEVMRGLMTLSRHKYGVPQLSDFLAACRPVLTDEEAFYEAVEQMHLRHTPYERDGQLVADDVWSDPAIYWAAAKFGKELGSQQYSACRFTWERLLKREREAQLREPKPVPQILRALPPPAKVSVDKQKQQQELAAIAALLRKPSAKPSGGRRTIFLTDEEMGDRKRAMAELVALKLRNEAARSEGTNEKHGREAMA